MLIKQEQQPKINLIQNNIKIFIFIFLFFWEGWGGIKIITHKQKRFWRALLFEFPVCCREQAPSKHNEPSFLWHTIQQWNSASATAGQRVLALPITRPVQPPRRKENVKRTLRSST